MRVLRTPRVPGMIGPEERETGGSAQDRPQSRGLWGQRFHRISRWPNFDEESHVLLTRTVVPKRIWCHRDDCTVIFDHHQTLHSFRRGREGPVSQPAYLDGSIPGTYFSHPLFAYVSHRGTSTEHLQVLHHPSLAPFLSLRRISTFLPAIYLESSPLHHSHPRPTNPYSNSETKRGGNKHAQAVKHRETCGYRRQAASKNLRQPLTAFHLWSMISDKLFPPMNTV